jgi:hypothetical protein
VDAGSKSSDSVSHASSPSFSQAESSPELMELVTVLRTFAGIAVGVVTFR